MDEKTNPLRELLGLRERMNRLFEESMGRFATGAQELDAGCWSPPVDIFETDGRLVLHVELPGIRREEVAVSLEGGTLVIEGERRPDPDLRPADFHRLERAQGPFRRTFRLPSSVAGEAVQAEMRDGVLRVTLPRASAEGAGTRIPVQTGDKPTPRT